MANQKSLAENDIVTKGRVSSTELQNLQATLEDLASKTDLSDPNAQVTIKSEVLRNLSRAFLALSEKRAQEKKIGTLARDPKGDYIDGVNGNDISVDIGVNKDRRDGD